MTQPIKLQLNADALAALFPEGSQARVELQNAVVAEFVRKHIKIAALGSGIQLQIEKAKKEAIEVALGEFGLKKDTWGAMKLTSVAQGSIADATRAAVRQEVTDQIAVAVNLAKSTVTHDAQAAVNRLVNGEIATAVKARVQEVAKGVLGG